MNASSRTLRRLLTMVTALVAGLGVLTLTPVPSYADDVTTYPGYTHLREPSAYLGANGWTVLHVDTEHATDAGFWYAIVEDNSYIESWTPIPVRNMRWQFQPWGTWCDAEYKTVGWNQWLGGYRCVPDVAKLTADFPDYPNRVAACRASTRHDYEDARPTVGAGGTVTWRCDDWVIDDTRIADSNSNQIQPTQMHICAPWERTGTDGYGNQNCYHEFYPWLNDPRFPDGGYAGPDTGGVTRTAEGEADATQTVTATQTRTARATVARGQRTVTVSGMVNGHRRSASGTAPVTMTAKATATRSATGSSTITRIRAASCTRPSAAEALTCAEELAQQAALEDATSDAHKVAASKAKATAGKAASAAAFTQAKATAQRMKITKAAIRSADQVARKRAVARLEALRHR